MDEKPSLYLQKLEEMLNHDYEEGEIKEFLCFKDFKARAVTLSDDFKNLSDDSFFNLYDIYIQTSRLYVHGLLQNIDKKRFYFQRDKKFYKYCKEEQLSTISTHEFQVRSMKMDKKIKQIIVKVNEKNTKEIKKFFNYKVDDKIAMDYLEKIFDRSVLHVPEEKLKKILQENGWPETEQ